MKKLLIISSICALNLSIYAADGAEIYKKCAGCHGQKADLKYHPKSTPLAKISKERRLQALEGYKYGTQNKYGMGGAMSDQVKNLSTDELKAVNEFIETLRQD